MKKSLRLVLKGLATILPLALTLYFLIWLLMALERLTRQALLWVMPDILYFPGLGILVGLVVLFLAGLLVNAYFIRHVIDLGEGILERIPLVKSIYGAIQDVTRVFSMGERRDMQSVVSLDMGNDMHLIGFVTGTNSGKAFFSDQESEKVGVYLPMSYQVGGYTLYVDRKRLRPLNIGIEQAMRIVITGGALSTPQDGARGTETPAKGPQTGR